MELYEELMKIKEKLGENLEQSEYEDVKKYLEEKPNVLLTDLYNNREVMDQFEKWKFDNVIKNKKVFAVVHKNNKMQIDYLKVKPDKYGYDYTDGIYIYDREQLFLTLQEAKDSLWNYRSGYIYTEETEKYINSIEEDKKELIKEYYGKSKLENIWFAKVNELNENKKIEKIYEIYTRGFLGAWYLVKDTEENRYIVKHKSNDVNTKFLMNQFFSTNQYETIESKELDISKYDFNSKKEYSQMLFDYLIEFKNKVEEDYFKLNLNRTEIIELFLKDYSHVIKERTIEYISPLSKLKKDLELQECFIKHVKFDIKCNIENELNNLNFSKDNWHINENNIEQFVTEFTQKAIYGENYEEEELDEQ